MNERERAELGELFMQVGRRFGETMHRVALQHDLTPMQAMTLAQVVEGALPTKEIARHLHCDPSNATGLVDQLEKRGLVRRTTPPHDRRVRTVEATAEGRAVEQDLRSAMGVAASVLDRLSDADAAELRRLLGILAG